MNQVAFNLIAIAIFAVTMTSLLGPFLHIPAAVPAGITAACLGLFTVDTLGLQGQGTRILLDWAARTSPEHRTRVIHHEAGHFLAAHLLGIPVTGYTLSAWEAFRQGQTGSGGVVFDCSELDAQLRQGKLPTQVFDRYATVWMAGGIAETLVYGSAEGGEDDVQKFRTVYWRSRRSPTESQQQERWFAHQARTLIQKNWAAYEALVAAMEQRTPVADCCQVIEQQR